MKYLFPEENQLNMQDVEHSRITIYMLMEFYLGPPKILGTLLLN